jgi:Transglycosylase SLT domain
MYRIGKVTQMKILIQPGLFVCVAMLAGAYPADVKASETLPQLCESAAAKAAEQQNIPAHILQTLTLAETGTSRDGILRPWPWAINKAGEGHWFATQSEMLTYAHGLVAAGETNFDVGCFQLNYRWHGQRFSSLADMSDPVNNAAYAAWFLRSKYSGAGSWRAAVGAYHSHTPSNAASYLARYEAIFAEWIATGNATAPAPATQAIVQPQTDNIFPLLIAGRASQGPSLVPAMEPGQRLIGSTE